MCTYRSYIFSISFLFFATRSPMSTVSMPSRSHLTYFARCALVCCYFAFHFTFFFLLRRFTTSLHFDMLKTRFGCRIQATDATHTHTMWKQLVAQLWWSTILSSRFESSVWNTQKKVTDTFHYYLYFCVVVVVGFFVSFSFWIVSMCVRACVLALAGVCIVRAFNISELLLSVSVVPMVLTKHFFSRFRFRYFLVSFCCGAGCRCRWCAQYFIHQNEFCMSRFFPSSSSFNYFGIYQKYFGLFARCGDLNVQREPRYPLANK